MSCIVGLIDKRRVFIGSDSYGATETCQIQRIDQKVFHVSGHKNAVIGFAGSFRMGQILQYSKGLIDLNAECSHKYVVTKFIPRVMNLFDKNSFIRKDETGTLIGDSFLLAYKTKLFQIDNDFQVAESLCGFDAIGSGYEYALGSLASTDNLNLNPIQRVYLALKAASKFGVSIGAPFRILCTTNDKEIIFEN